MIKKIAIICDYFLKPERIGGMDRFFWRFNQTLIMKGYIVDWYFPNLEPRITEYNKLNIFPWLNFSSHEFIKNTIYKNKYDIVIFHFFELCTDLYKQIKKSNPNIKILVVDHNPRPVNGYNRIITFKKKIKGILYGSYIDKYIAVSNYTKTMICSDFGLHLKSKTTVIYNGIEFSKNLNNAYNKENNKRGFRFIVACHLRKSKGVQDLIEAVYLMNKDDRNKVKIDIYGDGDYRRLLEDKITDKKLEKNFKFFGSVSDLSERFPNYDYLLQPTHMECFSLGILEALGNKVKVITTPVGGNPEVIIPNKNGYLLPVESPMAWSNFLSKLINHEVVSSAADFSVEIREKFSIEKMVQDHIKVITNFE